MGGQAVQRLTVVLAVLLAGCAALPPLPPVTITPAMLAEGRPLTRGVPPAPLPDADILGLDAGMRRFVSERVPASGHATWRLRELLRSLIEYDGFVIEYEERTYTAAETFRLRRANCLAFTNLFVALAREAGLDVQYQEVDVPPDWSLLDGSLVQNRHINAFVDLGNRPGHIVDFNMPDFRTSYDRRLITDERARAHYYSNVAVESMAAGHTVSALLNFRKAIGADPAFVPAWINLGSLYLRAGHPDWAEAAWRHALTLAPREYVAMSNLERLYRATDRVDDARQLGERIARHREQNPYYRYQLAEADMAAGRYADAIPHLRFAISRKANEDRFYALLGLAYLRNGDAASAQRWIARAEALAADDELKQSYHSKLELLRQSQDTGTPRGS